MEGVRARGIAQDGVSARGNAFDDSWSEREQAAIRTALRCEDPVKPVPDSDHFPPEFARCHHRAGDDGVQPGYIATTEVDGDAFRGCLHRSTPFLKKVRQRNTRGE